MWITHKKNLMIFKKWNWTAFVVLYIWCVSQNIFVYVFVPRSISGWKALSWAPLSPFGPYFNPVLFEFNERTIMLQSQIPWMILPWFFYRTPINLNK